MPIRLGSTWYLAALARTQRIAALASCPVDVEHVLAAVVLAARKGELDPNTTLSSDDPALVEVLVGHVKTVFEQFGGNVGRDD
jgi:hypothetical protein